MNEGLTSFEVQQILGKIPKMNTEQVLAISRELIAAIVILASALWTDNMLLQEMVTQIQAVGKAMVEVCSRWIE